MISMSFMMRRVLVATLATAISGLPAANAATVSNQGGEVLVNRGQGFVPVAANAELAPGGQVLVQPGGLATIAYASNCTVRVGSGVWAVQATAPCAQGTAEIDFTGRMNQAGPGAGTDPPGGGALTAVLLATGGIIAGALIISNNNKDDKPASP
jgi:hypothetical protein